MSTAKEVGGDFYDFYMVGEDKLAFLIADVSGKGIPAAMFMMTAKTLMKSLAEHGMDVAEIFAGANDKLCEGNDANMFVTAWMGILDLKTGYLTYANAGHNPPMIKRKSGKFEYLELKPNFILAGMEGISYQIQEIWLQPEDCIYVYTDGVTEAQNANGELFGDDRLKQSLNTEGASDMESLCEKVKRDVDVFVGENEQFDDMTMLAMKLNYLVQES
jgi:sigma-B regulation protein RsbU (phosphoserine phosphatase)